MIFVFWQNQTAIAGILFLERDPSVGKETCLVKEITEIFEATIIAVVDEFGYQVDEAFWRRDGFQYIEDFRVKSLSVDGLRGEDQVEFHLFRLPNCSKVIPITWPEADLVLGNPWLHRNIRDCPCSYHALVKVLQEQKNGGHRWLFKQCLNSRKWSRIPHKEQQTMKALEQNTRSEAMKTRIFRMLHSGCCDKLSMDLRWSWQRICGKTHPTRASHLDSGVHCFLAEYWKTLANLRKSSVLISYMVELPKRRIKMEKKYASM